MNLQDISPLPATIGTIIFILTAGTLFTAISDYRGWRALGAGGLPYNPFGWAIQWYLSWRMGKDTVSLECYDKPLDASVSDKERARNDTSYLKSFLPIREGQRKRAAHWVIPQRQLGNPKPSTNISAACKHTFQDLATKHKAVTQIEDSVLEKRGRALFVQDKENIPEVAKSNQGEITHFHASDASSHVTLSYTDAKEVISKGWGERHGLAGSIVPLGYIFLYAPESEKELDVIRTIMEASLDFMLGRRPE